MALMHGEQIEIGIREMKRMTISHAARKAGVGVETIRFYERRGLIQQPLKPANAGFRIYPEEVVRQIRFIREAQELGFSLREINELLSLQADPSSDCADVRKRAEVKRHEVDRKIVQLQLIRTALDELIDACPGHGHLRACSILDALANATAHELVSVDRDPPEQH